MAVRGYDELRDRRSLARRVRSDGRWGLWDRLTAQATLHPGRPQVVTALVSTRYGQELFPWPSRRHSSADYSDTVQMQNVTPPSDEVKRAFQPPVLQCIGWSMAYRHHFQIWVMISSVVASDLASGTARESNNNG